MKNEENFVKNLESGTDMARNETGGTEKSCSHGLRRLGALPPDPCQNPSIENSLLCH